MGNNAFQSDQLILCASTSFAATRHKGILTSMTWANASVMPCTKMATENNLPGQILGPSDKKKYVQNEAPFRRERNNHATWWIWSCTTINTQAGRGRRYLSSVVRHSTSHPRLPKATLSTYAHLGWQKTSTCAGDGTKHSCQTPSSIWLWYHFVSNLPGCCQNNNLHNKVERNTMEHQTKILHWYHPLSCHYGNCSPTSWLTQ